MAALPSHATAGARVASCSYAVPIRPLAARSSFSSRCSCSRIAPSPAPRRALVVAAARGGSSGGLLDGSTLVAPGRSVESVSRKPPNYKVLLHNDNVNRREYVVKVLLKVVQGLTVDAATVVMQEAHETGIALVTACAQDLAENYVENLRLNGLTATLEPGA